MTFWKWRLAIAVAALIMFNLSVVCGMWAIESASYPKLYLSTMFGLLNLGVFLQQLSRKD